MADAPLFEIEDLHVAASALEHAGGVEILTGISLTVKAGEVHAIVGPSGSGQSALATALMGSPVYEVTSGSVRFQGDDVTHWGSDVRAKVGMFLAFGDPEDIPGVSTTDVLRQALSARRGIDVSVAELRASLVDWMAKLGIDSNIGDHQPNSHRSSEDALAYELLHMAILEPEIAIVDETNPRLDDAALRTLTRGLSVVTADRKTVGTLAITSHQRLLEYLQPDHVHILQDGRIVASGGPELTRQLETDGYESFT